MFSATARSAGSSAASGSGAAAGSTAVCAGGVAGSAEVPLEIAGVSSA